MKQNKLKINTKKFRQSIKYLKKNFVTFRIICGPSNFHWQWHEVNHRLAILIIHKLRKLVETYLSHGFKEFTLQKGNENVEKNFGYKFEFLSLESLSREYLIEKGFEALWVKFIQQITSTVYIAKLSEATNMKLQDKNYKLEFTRYRPGDWSNPHYDKQHKVAKI